MSDAVSWAIALIGHDPRFPAVACLAALAALVCALTERSAPMSITLEDIRREADRRYAPLPIDAGGGRTLLLRPALRLAKDELAQLMAVTDLARNADPAAAGSVETVQRQLVDTLALVSDNPDLMRELAEQLDLAELQALLQMYSERTQLGEASRSTS